jgi:hypothetical protein
MKHFQGLVYSDEQRFQIVLDKTARVGQEPSSERRDALADVAARSIKHLSRTGKKIDEIQGWVTDDFPALDQNQNA